MRDETEAQRKDQILQLAKKTDKLIRRLNFAIDCQNGELAKTPIQTETQEEEDRQDAITSDANSFEQLKATCHSLFESMVQENNKNLGVLKYYKKSDKDVAILTQQYTALEYAYIRKYNAVNKQGNQQDFKNPQTLSTRIANIDQLEYKISTGRLWARRAALVGVFLGISALVLGVTLLMMTPVGAIGATGSAFILSLLALGAYLGFRGPVHSTASINIGGLPMNITTQVPSTPAPLLQAILMPLMFLSNMKRWTVNPKKEEDARNVQSGVMQKLIDECRGLLSDNINSDVKIFLEKAITQAESIFHESTTCRFDEHRNSAMAKAKNILQATAKILEDTPLANFNSVEELCNHKLSIGNDTYQYGDILNSRRRISLLTGSMTNTFDEISKGHPNLRTGLAAAISTTTIAASFRAATMAA